MGNLAKVWQPLDLRLDKYGSVNRIFTLELGRPRIAPELEKRILSHLRKGVGILKTAELCCVGTATVQRIKAEMSGPFDAASAVARENRNVSYTVRAGASNVHL